MVILSPLHNWYYLCYVSHYGALLVDLISVLLHQNPDQRPTADQVLSIPAVQPYVNHYVKRTTTMKELALNTPPRRARSAMSQHSRGRDTSQDKENVGKHYQLIHVLKSCHLTTELMCDTHILCIYWPIIIVHYISFAQLQPDGKLRSSTRPKSCGTPPRVMPLTDRKKGPNSAEVRTNYHSKQWKNLAVGYAPISILYKLL